MKWVKIEWKQEFDWKDENDEHIEEKNTEEEIVKCLYLCLCRCHIGKIRIMNWFDLPTYHIVYRCIDCNQGYDINVNWFNNKWYNDTLALALVPGFVFQPFFERTKNKNMKKVYSVWIDV